MSTTRPMYTFFECTLSSNAKKLREKLCQVELQLAYFLEHQGRRQQRTDIDICNIVAVTGVCTNVPWKQVKGAILSNSGELSAVEFPLCSKLAKEGRLLWVTVLSPYQTTARLDAKLRKCTSEFITEIDILQ